MPSNSRVVPVAVHQTIVGGSGERKQLFGSPAPFIITLRITWQELHRRKLLKQLVTDLI